MRALHLGLLSVLLPVLFSCDLMQTITMDEAVIGEITEKCEMDGSFYYIPYKGTFKQGQVYTVNFNSPDEAPIHLNIDAFDFDEEINLHEVFFFTALTSEEIQFSVYLRDDRLYGSASFSFTISEGQNGPPVLSADDAQEVAEGIVSQVHSAAPDGNKTWANATKVGAVGGSAVINGSYKGSTETFGTTTYTYYEYLPTTIDFVDYQDYAEEAASTGSVTLKGKITETHSLGARTSNYSGSWSLSGTLRLSGFYNDDVVFNATFSEDFYTWSGTLTTPSDSFDLSY